MQRTPRLRTIWRNIHSEGRRAFYFLTTWTKNKWTKPGGSSFTSQIEMLVTNKNYSLSVLNCGECCRKRRVSSHGTWSLLKIKIPFLQVTIPKKHTTYWCSLIQLPEFKSKHHITKVSTEVQIIAIKPVFIRLSLLMVKWLINAEGHRVNPYENDSKIWTCMFRNALITNSLDAPTEFSKERQFRSRWDLVTLQ